MEFITEDEKQDLTEKLEQLKGRRPIITLRIGEARAMGDLKENAEYHAAREMLPVHSTSPPPYKLSTTNVLARKVTTWHQSGTLGDVVRMTAFGSSRLTGSSIPVSDNG